jgi:hypothetical protein
MFMKCSPIHFIQKICIAVVVFESGDENVVRRVLPYTNSLPSVARWRFWWR